MVDNLERATGAVPKDVVAGEADVDKVRHSLKGLLEGVQAVESIMLKVLKQHGVARYDPINEKFDPNLHSALFEMPDPTKEPGTIANVTKVREACCAVCSRSLHGVSDPRYSPAVRAVLARIPSAVLARPSAAS